MTPVAASLSEGRHRFPPMGEVIWPGAGALRDFALITLGSVFIALMAQPEIILPFSPVPITLQPLAVGLTGALLGSRRGVLAVALYLAEGAAGLPVFAGGAGGILRFMGPTGGYLAGFMLSAFVVGSLCERGFGRSFWTGAAALLCGNACVHVMGLAWLSSFIGLSKAIQVGFIPFVGADLLKVVAAGLLLPGGWRGLKALGLKV